MITAKVVCHSKDEYRDSDNELKHANVYFTADYEGGRNKDWAEATPYLSLHMKLNAQAAGLFEQGQHYTLQFVEEDDNPTEVNDEES